MIFKGRGLQGLIPGMLVLALFSCETSHSHEETPERGDISYGKGSFVFDGYAPLQDKPLNVWYYNPGNAGEIPVMILLHGNSRAAESYRDAMAQYAYDHDFLLVVPEFSTTYFPSSRDYHQGGVLTADGEPVEEEYWAFSLIEPLFDHIKQDVGNQRDHYILYGFSAGSQFVHRFMMHKPDNRADPVVAASAGTYSMPDYDIDYSYGLKNTVVTSGMLQEFFSRQVTIAVGEADTVRSRDDLVKTPEADRQGWDRVERGQEFFNQGKRMSDSLDVSFNWDFVVVPGVGHAQGDMAAHVAEMTFGP